MMTLKAPIFEELYQQQAAASAAFPPWLQAEKSRAWKQFAKAGLPSRKQQEWRYMSLASLEETSFELSGEQPLPLSLDLSPYLLPGAEPLIFVDGRLWEGEKAAPSWQRAGMHVLPLALAYLHYGQRLQAWHKQGLAREGESSLLALNQALAQGGAYIYLEKDVHAGRPLQLLHIATGQRPMASFPLHVIELEKGASASVCESYVHIDHGASEAQQVPSFTNARSCIRLGPHSQLAYYALHEQGGRATHLAHTQVVQEAASHFRGFSLVSGGQTSRHSLSLWQEGAEASCRLHGLFLACGQQYVEQKTAIYHGQSYGQSEQYYKGLVAEQARGVFQGKIAVAALLQKVKALQLNKNLLLSPEAEVDSKPELEIDADDVKCSHGATVSQLREEELFYLKSRGISEAIAKPLLGQAFAREIILQLEEPQICQQVEAALERFFSKAMAGLGGRQAPGAEKDRQTL